MTPRRIPAFGPIDQILAPNDNEILVRFTT
jgi:hypothetical protein